MIDRENLTQRAEAARDLHLQASRTMPCEAESHRFRLRKVLDSRARSLAAV